MVQGVDGKRLSRESWTTKYADSEEENGNHTGDKVFDLQESTYWQTERGATAPHLPAFVQENNSSSQYFMSSPTPAFSPLRT